MNQLRSAALCLASALLCAAAAPPWNLWFFTFAAFVPLLQALEHTSGRRALALGALFGLAAAVLRFGFMVSVFSHFVAGEKLVTFVLSTLLFAIDVVRYAGLALAMRLLARLALPTWATFPFALVAAESACASLLPWSTGYTLGSLPLLAQAAELGGVPLLTVAVGLVNALLAAAWSSRGRGRAPVLRHALAAALVVALLAGYGVVSEHRVLAEQRAAPGLRVGVIQANMEAAVRPGPALDAYEDLSVRFLAEQRKVDLLVWPEGAVDFALEHTRLADAFRAYVRLHTRVPGAPALLAGGLVQRRALSDAENSAILIDEDRRALGSYGKVNPMPFGEYLPLAGYFPFLRDYFPNAGSIASVERPGFLTFRGHRIQPRICYEEVLASETREAVRDNAPELLIDLVDDAWFGATPASAFHLAIARMRAIEHRRYLVRAVNDGPSAIIDARGRLEHVAPIRQAATLTGTVRWLTLPTLFQSVGSAPAWALALFLLLCGSPALGRARLRLALPLTSENPRRSGRSA